MDLTNLIEMLKHNIAALTTVVTFASVTIGGAFAVESRYAKAADVADVKQQQIQIYSNMKVQQDIAVDTLRRQSLDDKLFELRLKEHPSQVDKALIERYKEQLEELNSRATLYKRKLKEIE